MAVRQEDLSAPGPRYSLSQTALHFCESVGLGETFVLDPKGRKISLGTFSERLQIVRNPDFANIDHDISTFPSEVRVEREQRFLSELRILATGFENGSSQLGMILSLDPLLFTLAEDNRIIPRNGYRGGASLVIAVSGRTGQCFEVDTMRSYSTSPDPGAVLSVPSANLSWREKEGGLNVVLPDGTTIPPRFIQALGIAAPGSSRA